MNVDIRLRRDPGSGAIGMQPLTGRGKSWIEAFASSTGGLWRDTDGFPCFWMFAEDFPQALLRDSDLEVSIGFGPNGAEDDRSADDWLGRGDVPPGGSGAATDNPERD